MTDFDLAREFEPGRDYQRLIELPAGIVSLDGVTNVTLDFDTSEMASTKLNVSNIRAINVPSNYELQILSSIVSGVTLYGPADEIEKLSADSIVAQIDCQSLNLTVGQQTIAVSIQIPSSSRIFATGHARPASYGKPPYNGNAEDRTCPAPTWRIQNTIV